MTTPFTATLVAEAAKLGLALTAPQTEALLAYMALIEKWNKVYNLTAVRDPADMLTHHLLDSLAVVAPLLKHAQGRGTQGQSLQGQTPHGQEPQESKLRVLDVGSGAGLPGTVLAIMCPQLDVTCVDTVGKKAAFIQNTALTLKLPNLRGVHARVEEMQAAPFDVVTSRAFSSLVDFVTLTKFHVKQPEAGMPGGVWMAMKGKHPADELTALPGNVEVFHVEQLQVPGLGAERCLVWMRANSHAVA